MLGRGRCSVNVVRFVLMLLFAMKYAHARKNDEPGWIYPAVVELAVGESVNITCRLNAQVFKENDSSNLNSLHFFNDTTRETVLSDDVVVVNATTIVYMLRNATEQSTKLLCMRGPHAITYRNIFVGSPPSDVTDFRCRNYDYEFMVCNFTQPRNPVLTQYNLTYYLVSPSYIYVIDCNYQAKPLSVCNITLNAISKTHFQHFTLKFQLRSINALGNKLQQFTFNTVDITVPTTTGEGLKPLNITTDTLMLSWKMPKYDLYQTHGLQWEVMLTPFDRNSTDFSSNAVVERRVYGELQMSISGLPYAYYNYTVRIRARVQPAIDTDRHHDIDEDLWSIPFEYSFRSEARLPDRPPRTDVGSFYLNESETNVSLYWEQLQPHEYNGNNFHYVVDVHRNGNLTSREHVYIKQNSTTFEWQKNSYYRYEIRSQNNMGISKKFSIIEIPIQTKRNKRAHTPPAVHSVYHSTNNSYTLTWLAPSEIAELEDYTVYWCSSKRALPTECQGSIHFQHVNRYARNFTTPSQPFQQEHTLNFAVSANYIDYNTGMHWTPCTMDVNSDLMRMEPEAQPISATSIKVQWTLERICLSVISGYNLTYCELPSNNSNTCLPDSTRNLRLGKDIKQQYEISNLKPYTAYQIQILMFSSLKESKLSEPLVISTFESAPSPPRQLKQMKVTNNSAIISWQPPEYANGVIRYYLINYNEHSARLNVTDDMELDQPYKYQLYNLSSWTDYTVNVTAYTIAASLPSNNLHLHTLIGVPSMPAGLIIRDNYVVWSRPAKPAGRLEFYELAVEQTINGMVASRRISIIMGNTSCHLPKPPGCKDPQDEFVFKVRAINAAYLANDVDDEDDDNENYSAHNTYESPDSYSGNDDLECDGGKNNKNSLADYTNPQLYRLYSSDWLIGPIYVCTPKSLNPIIYIIICSFVVALVVMALTYIARKKIIKMANIECTLPPGLATYLTKDAVAPIMQSDGIGMNGKLYASLYGGGASIHHQQRQQQHLHNEKHHLLSAVGNDSGYLGDSHTLEHNMMAAASNGCLRTISESSSADSMIDSNGSSSMEHELDELDINGAITTNSVHNPLPRINEEYISNALPNSRASAQMDNAANGYVNPTKILNWKADQLVAPIATETELQPLAQPSSQPPQDINNYISVNSLNAINPIGYGVSGYVQPSQLPKFFNPVNTDPVTTATATPAPPSIASSYTTLEQLGKMQPMAPPAISGYVTQRELNQFSQQHCN